MSTIDPTARFQDFLKSGLDENGKPRYWEALKTLSTKGDVSVTVNFQDLQRFDPRLAKGLLEEPDRFLDGGNRAIRLTVQTIDEDYVEKTPRFYLRISQLPKSVPLRRIRAEHLGKLIQIEAILTRASEVKPRLITGVFECTQCGAKNVIEQLEVKFTQPSLCSNPECKRKGPFKFLEQESEFRDWQRIGFQERVEELPAGQLPRTFSAVLGDDLVDAARPGDPITITGVLRSNPDTTVHAQTTVFQPYLDTVSLATGEDQTTRIDISLEDERRILTLGKDPFVAQKILNSIAPSLYGNDLIKEATALLLFGGVRKELPDQTIIRGDTNILLVGDPGTGKSQLLKYVQRLAPRAVYTSGKGTSAVGLTAGVLKDPDTGGMSLEAGALVLADRGVALIDELDKMSKEDRSACHEAFEQQTISIAKAGIVATLNARAAILAAANPAFGRYNDRRTAEENLNLPSTLLSRFDLIFIMRDVPDPQRDREMSRFILSLHARSQKLVEAPLEMEFLRKYIFYAKENVRPVIGDQAVARLQEYFIEMRTRYGAPGSAVAITARQLEGLVRLAEARARMCLRNEVTAADADASIRLMDESLRQVATNPETGAVDISMITVGKTSTQLNRMQQVDDLIAKLQKEHTNGIPHEILLEEAKKEGLDEKWVLQTLDHLKNQGTIYEPRPGRYLRTTG